MIDDVDKFHKKFGLPTDGQDVIFGADVAAAIDAYGFRLKFLGEEIQEFDDAVRTGDRVKAFDALIDLTYVALGTALFMGVTPRQWQAGWQAVHDANMAKVRAAKPEDSKRGTAYDVVKPQGWRPPERQLEEILSWQQASN